jgi:hypothetical protein
MEGSNIDDPEMRGITPRVVDTVFEKIEASPPTLDFTLKVSMVEIYLEKLRDLLDPTRDSLEVGAGRGIALLRCMQRRRVLARRLCVAACVVHPWWACVAYRYPLPPLLSLLFSGSNVCSVFVRVVGVFTDSGAQGLWDLRGGYE